MNVRSIRRGSRAPIFCALMLATACAASAQQPRRTCDAAVEYWQAFALLPRTDEGQQKIIAGVNSAPLDPAAQKLIEESAKALTQLHRGSACDACDWNLHTEDGYAMLMPHLAKGRELARLAFLRARQRIARRQFGPAVQDVCDALVLARRLGADAVVIAVLVEDDVEQTGVDAIAPHLKGLDAGALAALSDRLAKLPAGASLLDSVRVERQIGLETLITNLNATPAGDDWRQRLTESMGIGGPENPEAEAQTQLQSVNSPRQLAERLVQLRPLYDQLPDALKLPQEQAHARLAEIRKQAQGIPMGTFIVSDYSRVYDKHRAAQARLAMLRAAVAALQGGEEQLRNFPDPATGQPFGYHAMANGFELQSTLTLEGKPVTLRVGQE